MDLKREILKVHSKTQTNRIVRYVGNDPKRFSTLIKVFLAGPYRVTQRAAWPVAYCVEHHPDLVKAHLGTLLKHLSKPGIHDAVKRNTIRLLQFIDIPKRNQGQVAAICFQYLQDTKEPVAIRVFSMAVLGNLARENPELKQEIALLIEDHLPYASAAFRSRAKKVLKEIR
jgi:hypothetical protein